MTLDENKKVTDFLGGITDPRLQNTMDNILGDPVKMNSFEACQQYLKTLVANKQELAKTMRTINAVGTYADGGGGGFNPLAKFSDQEWRDLTPTQRTQVWEARKKQGGGKSPGRRPGKSQAKRARKAAAVAAEKAAVGKEETAITPTKSTQFGKGAHQKGKE